MADKHDHVPSREPARISVLRGLAVTIRALLAFAVLVALICGIPYGLVHYIGWPLPTHIPSWDEIQTTLLGPMTPELLLDVLACMLWPLWARFTFDVLAAVTDVVRATRWSLPGRDSTREPLRAMASMLVGAVVVAILSSRTPVPSVVAQTPAAAMSVLKPVAVATLEEPAPLTADTETVRTPEHGVHDSLWRIAERRLGDGNRWTDIWSLNCGKIQVDGQVLTTPSLIQPGWILQLPIPAAASAPLPQSTKAPPPQGLGNTIAPRSHAPQHHPPATKPSTPTASPTTGISLATGTYVGLGFAALITIALINVRLRRRRWYRPGTAEPDDASFAPVVRGLRIAHDTSIFDPDQETEEHSPIGSSSWAALHVRDRARATANAELPTTGETVVAVSDGRPIALDLARTRGIGLTGPGAHAAARALILSLAATSAEKSRQHTQIIVTTADAHALLGNNAPYPPPNCLRVVADLDTALDLLEAELLNRARQAQDDPDTKASCSPAVLVATPKPDSEARLQAILDNGSTLGLAGILLGQWRPGGTIRVRSDGTVGAASASLADQLHGARMFTLPETDAAALLTLLRAAQPTPEEPGAPELRQDNAIQTTGDAPDSEKYDFIITTTADAAPRKTVVEPPQAVTIDRHNRALRSVEQPDDVTESRPGDDAEALQAPVSSETKDTRTAPDEQPIALHVLGRLRLIHHHGQPTDIIDALAPRQREILVYLALHRDGVRRETLTATLWPEAPGDRPYNSFHATLSQLRKALRQATGGAVANLTVNNDGHYLLDPSLITVDLWHVQDDLAHQRRASGDARITALHRIADTYHGDLAANISPEWIDTPREALRRDVLDAISTLIREIGPDHPKQRLTLLEQARSLDPYNEAIYRDLMRTQARLGQHDAIPRTLSLLTSTLAELDEQPTHDTLQLADLLRRPRAQQAS